MRAGLKQAFSSPGRAAALGLLLVLVLAAIGAPVLAPFSFQEQDRQRALWPPQAPRLSWDGGLHLAYHQRSREGGPGAFIKEEETLLKLDLFRDGRFLQGSPESPYHPLGTDSLGRDILSRLLYGARVSLSVGPLAILLAFPLGLVLGGWAGLRGAWTDVLLMRAVELIQSLPSFYLFLIFGSLVRAWFPGGGNWGTLFVVAALMASVSWAGLARVIRGLALSLREEGYVTAARAAGIPPLRIVLTHIIPNTLPYTLVAASLAVPGAILAESGLSFLGLGVQEPQASWGNMLAEAQQLAVLIRFPWVLAPGPLVFLSVLAFNVAADGLHEALDPRVET